MKERRTVVKAGIASLALTGSLLAANVVTAASDGSMPGASAAEATASGATLSTAGRNALNNATEQASQAMLEVRAARVAIFNGLPEEGAELTTLARESLEAADVALRVYRSVEGEGEDAELRRDWVPFDMTVVEYIDIDADQQAFQALDRASVYLEQGKALSAAEELSDAGVEAVIATAYLPISNSLGLLEEAGSLLDDEQYHQANLVLKSIEDATRQSNVTLIQ